MSFDATCYCPKCKLVWYECANSGETYTCPECGHREIEPEELDVYDIYMDDEEELAIREYLKNPEMSYFKKGKK